jgi:hypothetical protein
VDPKEKNTESTGEKSPSSETESQIPGIGSPTPYMVGSGEKSSSITTSTEQKSAEESSPGLPNGQNPGSSQSGIQGSEPEKVQKNPQRSEGKGSLSDLTTTMGKFLEKAEEAAGGKESLLNSVASQLEPRAPTGEICGLCREYHIPECPAEDAEDLQYKRYFKHYHDQPWQSSPSCFVYDPRKAAKAKKAKEAQEGEEEAVERSFIRDGSILIEEIIIDGITKFALFDGNKVTVVSSYTKESTTYKPRVDALIRDGFREGVIRLPSAAAPYGSEIQLFDEITNHINKYVDLSPTYQKIASYYVMTSWVYDALNTISYIRFLGDLGTGKTRAEDVVGGLCYKPMFVSGAITPAPLYRAIAAWGGTMIIDEGDWRDSDEYNEVVKILNQGYEKGKDVLRCNKDNPDQLKSYTAYCPKIIGSRKRFFDQALESRCLTETMRMTNRKDIPIVLPDEFWKEQLQLRNKLLMFRFKNLANIVVDPEVINGVEGIEPRLKQATVSFSVLFSSIPSMKDHFRKFLREYQEELIEERSTSYEGLCIKALFEMVFEEGKEKITPSDIADRLNIEKLNERKVGKVLSPLSIKTKPEWIDEKTKRVFQIEKDYLISLAERYVPDLKSYNTYVSYMTYGEHHKSIINDREGQKKLDVGGEGLSVSDVRNEMNVRHPDVLLLDQPWPGEECSFCHEKTLITHNANGQPACRECAARVEHSEISGTTKAFIKCPQCPKTFLAQEELDKHLKSGHEGG